MEHRNPEDTVRINQLSARYQVPHQEVARWIEQGYAADDVDWAYRFADTSPQADVARMLEMRRQGMSWDDVRRSLEQAARGERNLAEQQAGEKLVPGAANHDSRYFYLNDARMPHQQAGARRETGDEGTPSKRKDTSAGS